MKFSVAISIFVLSTVSILFVGCSDSRTPTLNENNYIATSEVFGTSYPIAESPSKAPLLRWDFSGNDSHKYLLDMSFGNQLKTNDKEAPERLMISTQKAVANSDLLIESQGDGTAKLVMENTEITWSMSFKDEQIGPTTETQPPQEIRGLREDGTTELGESSDDMFVKMFFPLPSEALEIGESSVIATQIPFDADGVTLPVLGTITITLLDYVAINGQTCAHLQSVIDISDLQLMVGLVGTYDFSMEGTTESLFSITSNRFIAGEVQVQMAFTIEKPSSEVDFGDYDGPLPDIVTMSTIADERFHIQIVE